MAAKVYNPEYWQKIIDSTNLEGDLTDEELAQRLEAFQNIGTPQSTLDKDALRKRVRQLVSTTSFASKDPAWIENQIETSTDQLMNLVLNNDDATGNRMWKTFYPQLKKELPNFYTKPKGPEENIRRVQDLIETRKRKAEAEAALNFVETDLPNALTARREEYLGGVTDRTKDTFNQEVVPATRGEANVRGLLNSGYTESALTQKASGMQGDIDSLRADIESQDYKFLADAAYQNKVRQLLEGQNDYRSSLLSEQNSQLLEQGYRFEAGQNDLSRKFQEKMQLQNYQLQLKQQDAALKRQNEQHQKQQRSNTIGAIGTTAGTIVGGIYGGPAGAMAGGAAGGAAAGSMDQKG